MKNKVFKRILVSVGVLLALVILLAGGMLIFWSVTTLEVKDTEAMEIHGSSAQKVDTGREIRILTLFMRWKPVTRHGMKPARSI